MKTNNCGSSYSAIVGIGEKIKKIEKETGDKYLYLNRGSVGMNCFVVTLDGCFV